MNSSAVCHCEAAQNAGLLYLDYDVVLIRFHSLAGCLDGPHDQAGSLLRIESHERSGIDWLVHRIYHLHPALSTE